MAFLRFFFICIPIAIGISWSVFNRAVWQCRLIFPLSLSGWSFLCLLCCMVLSINSRRSPSTSRPNTKSLLLHLDCHGPGRGKEELTIVNGLDPFGSLHPPRTKITHIAVHPHLRVQFLSWCLCVHIPVAGQAALCTTAWKESPWVIHMM